METELSYTEHVEMLRNWLKDTASNMLDNPSQRGWCTLELIKLTSGEIEEYFSTNKINTNFSEEAEKIEVTNEPVAHLEMENDHIFGLNKMMVYRHQPRLKFYRDDLENKAVRTPTSLALSLAKLHFLQTMMQNRA